MSSVDPKKRFVSAPHRAGKVERDSDWNNPARGGRLIVMKIFSVKGLLISGILLALVAGGAAAALWLGLPAVQNQIPAVPMIVTLNQPANGSGAGAGSPVRASAKIVTFRRPVSAELWVDDDLVGQTAPIRVAENTYTAFLEWTSTPGAHVLVARVTDDQGHVGTSNVVRVEGLLATDSLSMQPFVARGGEMPAELAETYGTTLDEILHHNPELHEQRPLSQGQEILIPVPAHYEATWDELPQDAPPQAQAATDAIQLSPLRYWLGTALAPQPSELPLAPGLSASAQGCGASLALDDRSSTESGFLLYRLGPGESAFQLIATLASHSGGGAIGYSDPVLSGTAAYYAASFNPAGQSPGPIVQVALPSEVCGADHWSGELKVEGTRLISPVQVDQAYFYTSVNGEAWRRVPANPKAFLPAVQGGYDLSPFMAELAAGDGSQLKSLSMDGWGWSGGGLVSLGKGALSAAPGAATIDLGGLYDLTALQGSSVPKVVLDPSSKKPLYFTQEVVFTKADDFAFRWKTGTPAATSGRWEVSRSPYFLSTFLVAEGVEALNPSYEGYSYFNIPFDELLALTASIGDQPANPVLQGPMAFGSEESLNLGVGESVALLPSFGAAAEPSLAFGVLAPLGGGLANEYYVRMTPVNGNQAAGEASNTVIVRYDPEAEAQPNIQIPMLGPEFYTSLYSVEILEYTPGAAEDPNQWGCVEFVKVEPNSPADISGYEAGDHACPPSYTGAGYQGWKGVKKDLNKLGGYLEKGADWAAKAWQDIKAFAVQVILKYTPLGLQCQFAEGVALPEGTCQKVFSVGVDLALASMGIPPTIPNFDKLMDEGLDYAVELAAQEALKEIPACVGPCEDAVKDTIRQALEAAIDQVAGQSVAPSCVSANEAHKNGAEPWCPPPGAVVRPVLGAVDSPPTVLVRVTRRPDVPDPVNMPACVLSIGATYTLTGWNTSYPTFSASPFSGGHLPIPMLSPGESIKVAVALDTRHAVYFPWESYIGSPWVYGSAGSMIWNGTSHATAGAYFVVPPYHQGATPSACAPTVTGEEVGAQVDGWKLK